MKRAILCRGRAATLTLLLILSGLAGTACSTTPFELVGKPKLTGLPADGLQFAPDFSPQP